MTASARGSVTCPQMVSTAMSAMLEDEFGDSPELLAIGGRALREMTRAGRKPVQHVARRGPYQRAAHRRTRCTHWNSDCSTCAKISARLNCGTNLARQTAFANVSNNSLHVSSRISHEGELYVRQPFFCIVRMCGNICHVEEFA